MPQRTQQPITARDHQAEHDGDSVSKHGVVKFAGPSASLVDCLAVKTILLFDLTVVVSHASSYPFIFKFKVQAQVRVQVQAYQERTESSAR